MDLANIPVEPQLVFRLRVIANALGYGDDWMREQIEEGRRHVAEMVTEYARNGIEAVRHAYQELEAGVERRHRYELEDQARNFDNEIGHEHPGYHEEESLSNSPAEEEMAPEAKKQKIGTPGDKGDHHAPDAQEGLDTIAAEGPVWTHFPNTARSRLRWRATIFQKDQTSWLTNVVPFGNVSNITSSALGSTTGGASAASGVDNDLVASANTGLVGYDFYTPYLIQLRMTSPYNIMKALGTLNATNNSRSEPNWLALFDSKYQYYQVHETDWGVTLHFGRPNSGSTPADDPNFQNLRFKIFWRYTNQDDPPTKWSLDAYRVANVNNFTSNITGTATGQIGQDQAGAQNLVSTAGATPLTSDDYERMGGWNCKTVSYDTTRPNIVHLGGKYKFGQCKMDVKTLMPVDAAGAQSIPTAEGMTLSRSTPQFPEVLSIIVCYDYATTQFPSSATSVKVPFSMQFDTNQLINWADLRANFKFPTPNCSSISGSNMMTDEQYFWRGAAYS